MKIYVLLFGSILLIITLFLSCSNNNQHKETAVFSSNVTSDSAFLYYAESHYYIDTIDTKNGGMCVFHYTNNGNSPLIITGVVTSCGCIEKIWNPEPLARGQSDSIVLKIKTLELGRLQKAIVVKNNSINEPVATIRLEGYVIKGDN